MRLIDADVLPEISLFGTTEYINVKKAKTIPAIPINRIKQLREEIENTRPTNRNFRHYEGEMREAYKVLCLIDNMIEEYK